MDYQDASNSPSATDTSSTGSSPVARPDVDGLAPGSMGPATGNTITGSGTITGTAGADSLGDAPASIVTVQGAGGSASPAGAAAQVNGQYGVLTIDAQGNFSYVRNGGTPDGVEDVFGYTLADRDGSTSNSTLTIQIGQTQSAALDGVVNLPAGVELSDIRVQGRDLVVTLPDGSTMLIPGGAVFVPQLVIGDTQVPASNVAALLVNSEAPAPAAGSLQSSGGNFANPVPPLDPGVPLGDLIPPTELAFPQPDFEEIGQDIDEEPEAGLASAELDDDEQSNGNAGGVGDDPFGKTDSGFLPGSDGDGSLEWALLATGAPTGFSYSAGPNGSVLVFQNGNPNAVLRIDVNADTGAFTVTQLGAIAHPAGLDENNLFFPISYTVTDEDNDSATGTLTINVDDDTPIARNDTDALASGQKTTDGNVITAVGTTSAPGSADSPGADGLGTPGSATDGVNGILAGTSGAFTSVPVGGVTINGTLGSLLINQDGSYVYTRFDNARQGGTDVFTYRIFDGDGDETTATLTITVPADPIPVPNPATAIVDDDGLVPGDQNDGDGDDDVPNNDGDNNQATFRGTLSANFSTDVPGSFNLSAMNNLTATVGQETVRYSWNSVNGVLTATIEGGARNGLVLFTVDIDTTADPSSDQFTVTLVRNVLHEDQAANTENNAAVVLNFTAVDSNGDTANSTLTITFDDDMPDATLNGEFSKPVLVVDESPLSEDGDNVDTKAFAGAFGSPLNYGADLPGSVTYQLILSGQGAASGLFALDPTDTNPAGGLGKGAAIVLYDIGGVIYGSTAANAGAVVPGNTYFTISVDGSGNVTLTRSASLNLWHDDAGSSAAAHDDPEILTAAANTLQLRQTLTDSDGDSDSASIDLSTGVFRFEDDGPSNGLSTGFQKPVLVVDESPLSEDGDNSDTKAFAGAFLPLITDFGTDGPGSVTYQFLLSGQGAASGLFALDPSDTETAIDPLGKGAAILLYNIGGVIYGSTAANAGAVVPGNTYFTISVDGSGNVTLDRSASLNLWHDDAGSTPAAYDDPEILTAAANTLQLQKTVTDADGDTASAAIDLSTGVFRFEDDGPANGLNGQFTKPVLVVDESPLTGAGNDGDNSDTQAFAGAFAPLVTDFGTDGPGSATYQFLLSAPGAASGLFALDPSDTETAIDPLGKGAPILLYNIGGVIYGSTAASAGAVVPGNTYFTISVDGSGNVTLTRSASLNLWHDEAGSSAAAHDDPEILTAAANTLQLQKTVTDADGDTASAAIDLSTGVFRFEDDGPTADPDLGSVNEGGTLNVNAANGVRADDDFGTDGPGTIIGVAAGSNTSNPVTGSVGVQIETALGFLTLQADGSYTYTSKDGTVPPGGTTDTFVYTIRDADGDTSTTTLTINIGNVNKIPVATQPDEVWLDDDTLSGNPGGPGDRSPDTQNTAGFLTGTGGDGDLDVYLSAVQTLPTGFTYAFDAAAPAGQQWLIISQGGTAVIKVTLVNETGAYTVTQLAAIDHAADGNTEGETLLGNLISQINVSFYVQDSDAPPDQSTTKNLVITIDDDTPENNSATVSITVHEDALNNANAVGNNEGGKTTTASFTVAQIQGLVNPGADTPVTIGLNAAIDGVNTGLTQNGVNIVWDYVSATQVRGLVGNDPTKVAFTLTRNGSNYDFVLLDNIDNTPTAAGDADTDSLSLANVFTATDADSDTIIIDGGASVLIENDVPTNNAGTVSITVHEDALNNANAVGNSTGEGAKTTTASFTVAQIQGLVNPGADSPVAITFNDAIDGVNTGLTQNGVNIVWDYIDATHVRGLVNNDPTKVAFTLTRNGSNYDFVLLDNIDNTPTAAGDADTDSLSLANVFVATDTDGDKVIIDGGASVLIENDVPTNNAGTVSITVHEDALNNANAVGNSAGEGAKTTTASFTIAQIQGLVNPGADSPVVIGLNDAIDGVNTGLTQNGVNIVWDYVSATQVRGLVGNDPTKVAFTLTLNGSNYDFVLLDNIDNNPLTGAGDADTDSLSLANVFTATDTDGDKVIIDGGASVLIENDVPIAAIAETGQNVSLDESAGNQGDSNDVDGPLTVFDGVANKGDDPDVAGTVIQFAFNNTAIVNSTGTLPGADSPVTTVFSLATSDPNNLGVDSGLDTTAGVNIFLFVENGIVVGRVGATAGVAAGGPAAFAIAIDQAGKISMVEYLSIQHNLNGLDPDDSVSILDGALKAVVTVTDTDGDKSSASTDIGNRIIFQDSGPIMTAASNINIQNSSDVAADGTFAYNLGADGARTDNDVFKSVTFSAVVNGNTVQTTTPLTQVSETASTAVFSFSFTYATGPGTPPPTATTNGTITFYKDNSVVGHPAGTYTVDLDSQIAGFTVNQTGGLPDDAFQGYVPGGSVEDNTGTPLVSVAEVASDLFLQFTGAKEPSNGPNADGNHTTSSGAASVFTNGEFFVNDATGVSTSGSAAGVAGDTMGPDEIMTFNLYATNPTGNVGGLPTQSATSMFMKFDGIGDAEDFIVILRLWADTNGNGNIDAGDTFTTKAVLVQNSDILKGKDGNTSGPGAYSAVALDNNDGLVIIESNDYNEVGENYKIIGAQVLTDPTNVTGTAINLNNAIGPTGGSDGADAGTALDTQPFSDDVNTNAPMKISSIGFLRTTTTAQNAQLTFNVTIQDGDNDSITQTVTASVTSSADSSTPIVLGAPVTTIQSAPIQESFASNDNTMLQRSSQSSSNTVMMGALAAAAMTSPGYAVSIDDNTATGKLAATVTSVGSDANLTDGSGADSSQSVGGADLSTSVHPDMAVESAAPGTGDATDTSLTSGDAPAASQPTELDAGTEAPSATDAPSPFIAQDIMLPAEMLESSDAPAAANDGIQHNAIVGKVLVDALNGGDAPNLDSLINAVTGGDQSGGLHSLQPVASLEPAAVPLGDMANFAGFTAGHDMPILEQMVMHQDAAPAQA